MEKEGPIHKELVKKRIAASLRVRRGRNVNLRLDSAIHDAATRKSVRVDGDFLWPLFSKQATLRVPESGGYRRSISEVPPQEISLAVIQCVNNSISITEQDLIKEAARLFGWRTTTKVSDKLQRIICNMIMKDRLRRKAGKIILTDKVEKVKTTGTQ